MSEAPPESEPDSTPPPSAAARRDRLPMLALVGWMVLAIGLIWLWRHPANDQAAVAKARAELTARIASLEKSQAALVSGVAGLRRDAKAAAGREQNLEQNLRQRLDGLTASQTAAGKAEQTTKGRLDALAKRLDAAMAALKAVETETGKLAATTHKAEQATHGAEQALAERLTALEKRPSAAAALASAETAMNALSQRLDGFSARQGRLSERLAAGKQAVEKQLAALEASVAHLKTEAGAVPALSARAERLATIATAEAALAAGRPLGTIAHAPPALSRFATTAPPTEAALRASFPAVARAALAASRPTAHHGFWAGVWSRLGGLVTIRRGDKVILGDPAAGVIAHARDSLDAGDLPGAVAALGALHGDAAKAMADWLGRARSLLAARAALSAMAAAG